MSMFQRRLSDPSSNLNNYSRGGWKTKSYESAGAKSRSENEGLDSLANGVSEIEAGDLRDGIHKIPVVVERIGIVKTQ